MLDVLHDNSTKTAKYLVNVIKNLIIPEYNGNNANTVVSIIHTMIGGLINLVDTSSQSVFTGDFAKYILDIFNTTSVTKFNALFVHYSIATRLTEFHTKMSNKPRISEILSFTETQYLRLYLIGQWSVVDTKINATSFTAITKGNFLNCSENHSFKDCQKHQK